MTRRPPRSTRTDTLFPYTTLFRSLVLSPLIALMKDQVDKLPARVAPAATFVNSSLTSEETADRLAAASAGHKRRSEEHTSELQSLMRISYAVFCLKKKKQTETT